MSTPTISQALESLPVVFTGGAGVGAGIYFFKWLFDWVGKRVDRREDAVDAGAARVDAATARLIQILQNRMDQLTERLTRVEEELEACRSQHAEARAEVMLLRSQMQGKGDAKQAAAAIVAEQRLRDKGLLDD